MAAAGSKKRRDLDHAVTLVQQRVWEDPRVRRLRRSEPTSLELYLYLLTGPRGMAMPGVWRIGRAGLADNLGWSVEDVQGCWSEIEESGLAIADWPVRLVYLTGAYKQRENAPVSSPQAVRWGKEYRDLPDCDLKARVGAELSALIRAEDPLFLKPFQSARMPTKRTAPEGNGAAPAWQLGLAKLGESSPGVEPSAVAPPKPPNEPPPVVSAVAPPKAPNEPPPVLDVIVTRSDVNDSAPGGADASAGADAGSEPRRAAKNRKPRPARAEGDDTAPMPFTLTQAMDVLRAGGGVIVEPFPSNLASPLTRKIRENPSLDDWRLVSDWYAAGGDGYGPGYKNKKQHVSALAGSTTLITAIGLARDWDKQGRPSPLRQQAGRHGDGPRSEAGRGVVADAKRMGI